MRWPHNRGYENPAGWLETGPRRTPELVQVFSNQPVRHATRLLQTKDVNELAGASNSVAHLSRLYHVRWWVSIGRYGWVAVLTIHCAPLVL